MIPKCKWRDADEISAEHCICRSPLLRVPNAGRIPLSICEKCSLADRGGERPIVEEKPKRIHLCESIGRIVAGHSCGCRMKYTYECGAGHGSVSPARQCQSCVDYKPDIETQPKVGVVIGVYDYPKLTKAIILNHKKLCPEVPLLIYNDRCPHFATIKSICELEGIDFSFSEERLGHSRGDIAAFIEGIQWGSALGLDYVIKLSQRFIPTKQNWAEEAALEIMGSGKVTASRLCRYPEFAMPMRTEAVVMNVPRWNARIVSGALKIPDGRKPAEYHIHSHAVVFGEIHPWSALPEHRGKVMEWALWHDCSTRQEYERFCLQFGFSIDSHFDVGGRHKRKDYQV